MIPVCIKIFRLLVRDHCFSAAFRLITACDFKLSVNIQEKRLENVKVAFMYVNLVRVYYAEL